MCSRLVRSPRLVRYVALAGAASLTRPAAARAQVAVLSSTVQERTAAPGEAYTGTILVRNGSRAAQTVRVYQTDYRFYADGTSYFDAPGSTPRSNARWVTPSSGSVVVPPGAEAAVPYAVRVPTGDSLAGTYWSTVMVEGVPAGSTRSALAGAEPGRPQVGIGTVVRYAVQVATHVGAGARTVRFSNLAVAPTPGGGQTLELVVENAGERGYRPRLWVEVYDATGALRTRAQQERGLLYPGTTLRQRFALGTLPRGAYKAVLFADTGEDAVYAAPYKLSF